MPQRETDDFPKEAVQKNCSKTAKKGGHLQQQINQGARETTLGSFYHGRNCRYTATVSNASLDPRRTERLHRAAERLHNLPAPERKADYEALRERVGNPLGFISAISYTKSPCSTGRITVKMKILDVHAGHAKWGGGNALRRWVLRMYLLHR